MPMMSRTFRSHSSTSDPGAAQFITNLSPRQLQHLQFSVPAKDQPARFSQFLEGPRRVPVPNRFTFDALDVACRKGVAGKETKHVRNDSRKSKKENGHARKDSGKSRKSETSARSRSDTTTTATSSRPSIDLLKEAERVASVGHVDWRFYATGVCLCLINLVAAWDVTTLSITLPTIAKALHGSAFDSFWLAISFLVAATCSLPLFATLSDIFGRKPMLLSALTFFTTGSFIAAVTGNMTGLHLGRSIQGIGGGGIYALSSLIVSDLVSAVDRKTWSAVIGATWAIGALTGPLIAGALADQDQWRWIFWLNLPPCAVAFIVLAIVAELKPPSPGSVLQKLGNVDWLGYVLFSGSLVSVLLGLTWGGTLHPWSNFHTTIPIQFGVIGLLVFFVWSWFSPFPTIISLGQFLDPTSLVTYLGAAVQGAIVFAVLYFLPLYFSVIKPTHSLVQTAACLCAWTLPLAVGALVAFFAIHKTNLLRPLTWFAWFLLVLGVALTTLFSANSTTLLWVWVAIISGSGIGILYPSLSTLGVLCRSEEERLAKAVTNHSFFQSFGQTLGVAIGSTVFQNQLYKQFLNNPVLETAALGYAEDSVAIVNTIRSTAGIQDTLKAQVQDSYIDSLRVVWVVLAALAGVAMLASLFIRRQESKTSQETEMKTLAAAYVV